MTFSSKSISKYSIIKMVFFFGQPAVISTYGLLRPSASSDIVFLDRFLSIKINTATIRPIKATMSKAIYARLS